MSRGWLRRFGYGALGFAVVFLCIFFPLAYAQEDTSQPHECVHNQLAAMYNPTELNVRYKRASMIKTATSTARVNMRIHIIHLLAGSCNFRGEQLVVDGGSTVVCTDADVLTPWKVRSTEIMMQRATNFIHQALLVDPVESMNVPENACSSVLHPAIELRDKDFVLFVTLRPGGGSTSTIAWAITCARDAETGRPIVGQVNFLPNNIRRHVSDAAVHVALHEITHALGFSNLAKVAKPHVGPNGEYMPGSVRVMRPGLEKDVTLITTPKVLEVARRHFDCPTLDGVEVEDAGGSGTAGSHWKKRILFDEALNGVFTSAGMFYSSFTLAFLEDLGYYTANYSMAEDNFRWGKNRTCRFLYNKCNEQDESVNEFCFNGDAASSSCTYDRLGMGRCDLVNHPHELPFPYHYFDVAYRGGGSAEMDYCPSVLAFFDGSCLSGEDFGAVNLLGNELGPHSRCFLSNMVAGILPSFTFGPRCFPMACTESGQILIRIQGQTVPCPENGEEGEADTSRLRGIYGRVDCPASRQVCDAISVNGLSKIPPSTTTARDESLPPPVVHSPLNFTRDYAGSCEERTKCAMDLPLTSSACRPLAQRIHNCFGTDCGLAMRMWFGQTNLTLRCGNPERAAKTCVDGWMGALELCGVASASLVCMPWICIAALLFSLLVAAIS